MTVQDALRDAARTIALRDAETLLLHRLGRDRAWLFTHIGDELSASDLTTFHGLTARRAAREPLQYITGMQEFFGLSLRVTPATLIPRPETEHLVEAVLDWAKPLAHAPFILDVGTGTGAIAIALATHLPSASLAACDLSAAALAIAKENAAAHGLSDRIAFAHSDLLSAFTGAAFDAVVSNPPYVPTSDAVEMQPEVRDFEPHAALFAGSDGLEIYRRLIPQAHAALRSGGLLAMEIGFGQRDALAALLCDRPGARRHDWTNVRFLNDYADIPRVVLAERA